MTNSEKAKTQYAGVLYGEVDGDGCLVMDSSVEIFVPVDFGSFFSATEKEYIESTMIALVYLQQTEYSIDEFIEKLKSYSERR